MNIGTFIPPEAPAPSAPSPVPAVTPVPGVPAALFVRITHEPFMPWFTLEFNGQTEDLDHEQALEWFRERGAKNMDKVNDAINQAFNFLHATVTIGQPKTPPHKAHELPAYMPKI